MTSRRTKGADPSGRRPVWSWSDLLHRARLQVPRMPGQCLAEQVRRVLARAGGGPLEVVQQRRLVVRVGALLDDLLGAAARRQTTQVGQTPLGDYDMCVVLGVVDMAGHGHDAGDRPAL